MKTEEALSLLGLSIKDIESRPKDAKRRARHLLSLAHPDTGSGSHERFIKLNEAYALLFKNGTQHTASGSAVPFKYSPPKPRRTISISDIESLGNTEGIDIILELPIEYGTATFPTGSTKLLFSYQHRQKSYIKSLVLPEGTRTLAFEGEVYEVSKPARYVFKLKHFTLYLDIHFQ